MILGDCISLMQLGSTCPIRGATRREQASQIKAFSHSSIASWRECDLGSTRFVDKRCVNMLGSPWSSRQYQSDMGEHGEVYITLWSDAKELFFSTWTQIYGCWFQWRPHSYFFHFFSFLLNCPIKYSTALMAESDFAWAQHSISDISGCSWICSYFPFHCRPLCPLLGLECIDFPIRQFSEFLEIFMGAHHHVDVISSKGFLRFICQSLSMALSRDHGKFGMLKGWGLMHEEVCVPLRGWHWLTHVETWLLHAIAS